MKDRFHEEINVGDTIIKAWGTGSSVRIALGVVTEVEATRCKFYTLQYVGALKRDQWIDKAKTNEARSSSLIINLGYVYDEHPDRDEIIGELVIR